MNRLKSHKEHLSMELIRAYLENRLNNHDRFRVERHLLDCDLCQEAMDGYAIVGGNHNDLISGIQKAVDQSVIKSKPSPWFNYRTYGIAAAMLILVTSIYFLFDFQEIEEDMSVTQNEKIQPEATAPDLAMNDAEEEVEEEIAKEDEMPIVLKESSEEPPAESEISGVDESTSGESVNSVPVDTDTDALIAESQDRITVEEDFFSQAEDPEETTLFADQPIAMDMTEEEAAPLAAPAMERAAPPSAIRSRKAETASGAGIQSGLERQEPVPVDGFEIYFERLYSNLQYPEAAETNSISGEVEVSFSVNRNGELEDFNIVKSLSAACDEEAIRLIKTGGAWLPAISNGTPQEIRTSVTVRFDLP